MSKTSSAQDATYSSNFNTAVHINPALAFVFKGTQQQHITYRNQWQSDAFQPYKTFLLSSEWKTFGIGKACDYLGIGLYGLFDKQGEPSLNTTYGHINVAYYKSLSYYGNNFLGISITPGFMYRTLQYNASTDFLQQPEVIPNSTTLALDVNMGAIWYFQTRDRRLGGYVGAGRFHINGPEDSHFAKQTTLTGASAPMPTREVYHAGLNVEVNGTVIFHPSVYYQRYATSQFGGIRAVMQFNMSRPGSKEVTAVYLGGNIKMPYGFGLQSTIEMKGLRIGLSYDYSNLTLNKFASTDKGAFELTLGRRINKPGKNHCPQYFNCAF